MHRLLEESLTAINAALLDKDIKSFWVGKTNNITRRFQEYYEEIGCHDIKEIANGEREIINQAEIDLLQYFREHRYLGDKLENPNRGGGGNEDSDKLYIVVTYHTGNAKTIDDLWKPYLSFLSAFRTITLE